MVSAQIERRFAKLFSELEQFRYDPWRDKLRQEIAATGAEVKPSAYLNEVCEKLATIEIPRWKHSALEVAEGIKQHTEDLERLAERQPEKRSTAVLPPRLQAALDAYQAVRSNPKLLKGKTPQQALTKWLGSNAARYGLLGKGKPNKTAIQHIAYVATWDSRPGPPKSDK